MTTANRLPHLELELVMATHIGASTNEPDQPAMAFLHKESRIERVKFRLFRVEKRD
jgi:hypothetical protein